MSFTAIIFWIAGSIVTVGAAYLGARIGGKYTLEAVNETYKKNMEAQEKNKEAMIKSLLQALYDEIETIWELYKDKIGPQIDIIKEGEPFNFIVPITQEYFTVYNGNALLIGHIPDADLRKAIVTTYTKARGMIDNFRLNNELVTKKDNLFQLAELTQNGVQKDQFARAYGLLIGYADKIKTSHDDLKLSITDLMRRLQKEGVLYENRK